MDEEKREGREEERPKTRCLRCRGTGVIFWGCGEDPSKCDECGGSGEVEKKGGEERLVYHSFCKFSLGC